MTIIDEQRKNLSFFKSTIEAIVPSRNPSTTTTNSNYNTTATEENNNSNNNNNNNNNNDHISAAKTQFYLGIDSPSSMTRRAMSVMSCSSYQYASTLDDNISIQSAPQLPDNQDYFSKHDLNSIVDAHQDLLNAVKQYREQMSQFAMASANLGMALETVAKNKASLESGEGLQAAAGFQFLISNHHQILENMIHKACELPLQELLESHQANIKESQQNYDVALDTISKKIRATEAINQQQAKKGQRDIYQYKRTLQDLTRQVNELDHIKEGYQHHMAQVEREQHQTLLNQTGWLIRAQVDLYEFLSSKGLADSHLEQLIQQHPDPFCAYDTTSDSPNEVFTVLPTTTSLIDPIPFGYHHHHHEHEYEYKKDPLEIKIYGEDEEEEDDQEEEHYQQPFIEHHQQKFMFPPFIYTRPSTESFHQHIQNQTSPTSTTTTPTSKLNNDSSLPSSEKKDINNENENIGKDNEKKKDNETKGQQQDSMNPTNNKYHSTSSISHSGSDSGLSRNDDWNDDHRKETLVGVE